MGSLSCLSVRVSNMVDVVLIVSCHHCHHVSVGGWVSKLDPSKGGTATFEQIMASPLGRAIEGLGGVVGPGVNVTDVARQA